MTLDVPHLDLLAQVAVWYYEDGLDQEAIGQRIGRSRSMVSRLLNEARQAGLVEIRVHFPLRTHSSYEAQLVERFGLKQAIVLAEPPPEHSLLLRRLGELGARCLQESLHDNVLIGVGSGTGVHAVVRAMPSWSTIRAKVVQIVGAVGYGDPIIDGAEVARWLAEKLEASFHYLSAPLIVRDERVAEQLLHERSVVEVLRLVPQLDVALIGVGSVEPGNSSLSRARYLTDEDLLALGQRGVVGDVLGQQLDSAGRVLDLPVNRRVIGPRDLTVLRSIPRVIAVAGGVQKARAIRAALRGRYPNILVTDAAAAAAVLALE